MMKRTLILATAMLAALTAEAPAWDEGGHLLVGEIAARRLQPAVLEKVEELAAQLDSRFNGGQPYNAVTAGVWLDDQRGLGKANPWSRWHYVDVPCDGSRFDVPPPPHALWAMGEAAAVLRNSKAAPSQRAVALAQVMHLAGDLHQPLHMADRHDRGGNEIKIAPLFPGKAYPSNLHAFWDGAYRYDAREGAPPVELWRSPARSNWPRRPGEPGPVATQANAFLQEVAYHVQPIASDKPWSHWARETHGIACWAGWPAGALPASQEPVTLSPGFIHTAHLAAVAQVVQAGERLGLLLNKLLAD